MKTQSILFFFQVIIVTVFLANCSKDNENSKIPAKGLVAYYAFNGNANDKSGENNDGEVFGATLVPDRNGKSNGAYAFDGNDYIEVPYDNSLNLTEDKSISVWIYLYSDTVLFSFPTIISKNDINSPYPTYCMQLNEYAGYGTDQYKTCFFFGSGTDNYSLSTTELYPNYKDQWVHFAATYSQTDSISKIYVNGVLSNSFKAGYITSNENTNSLHIGKSASGSVDSYFDGIIDDIRIYDRVLKAKDVEYLFEE